ncbi:hypothetical protein GQ55_3G231700 [Panicum hallii var. hallii]|uniref:Uncharacterized protein n=1 Tax=Panicum hallii var. hallii TaxID=1504633 RepID=A0A2T7ECI2_9POAL|nr:hypothetical protein GQ55_3G231700 [Panicum hallii var. hallii]
MPPAPSQGSARGGGAATPPSKPQSPLRITHDGEFYARLLTRESSLGNPSFRYYGAGPGAVPFVWESQPGTPKDAYSSRMLAAGAGAPVITPPPSYHLRGAAFGHSARRHGKAGGGSRSGCRYKLRWIKVGFIATVFRRLAFGKSCRSSSSSVKPSPSTRWLFSGSNAADEARDQEYCGGYEPAPPPTRMKGVLRLGVRPRPWMVQFCSGQREQAGWVYGWRP